MTVNKTATALLQANEDPMGSAIMDYQRNGKAGRLRVFSSQFDEDEIPVSQLFRSYKQMPLLEQKALQSAEGRTLDVGAGSGCHALALQEMGKDVTAIDISPLSVEVMRERGVRDARQINFFDERFNEQFDTILLLMNGSGIIGNLSNMPVFFRRLQALLAPEGVVYMDSSDLKYLFEEEDGSYAIDLNGEYYGLVDFKMQYKNIVGKPFDWLYIDIETLSYYASLHGFKAEIISEGKHYDYLCKLYRA